MTLSHQKNFSHDGAGMVWKSNQLQQ
jgi:hypothetical protein